MVSLLTWSLQIVCYHVACPHSCILSTRNSFRVHVVLCFLSPTYTLSFWSIVSHCLFFRRRFHILVYFSLTNNAWVMPVQVMTTNETQKKKRGNKLTPKKKHLHKVYTEHREWREICDGEKSIHMRNLWNHRNQEKSNRTLDKDHHNYLFSTFVKLASANIY